MKILHLNDFSYPHVAGPAKHMADVMRFTFQPENHIAVSFDYNKSLKREENYNGIPHFRYNPIGENAGCQG